MVEPSSRLLASLRLSVTAAASPARAADPRDTSALVVGPALSAAADDDDGTLQRALGELHAAAEAWRRGRLGALYAHEWAGRPTGMHTAGAAAAEGDALGGFRRGYRRRCRRSRRACAPCVRGCRRPVHTLASRGG